MRVCVCVRANGCADQSERVCACLYMSECVCICILFVYECAQMGVLCVCT